MARLAVWLLAMMLLVSASLASDDYIYDEEAEEEVASTHVPVFSSRSQKFDVMAGDSVTLPCLMDKADNVIGWKSTSENGTKVHHYTGPVQVKQDARFKLEETGNKGNSLVISDLKASDSGTYTCEVYSTQPVSLTHTVNVKYAPMVKTNPENGVVVVSQESAASLMCTAKGNPKPTITWTREGGLLPDGKKKMEGMELAISSVERSHMGNYACTVDNGIGDAIVKNFRLEVNFAPEIEVAMNKVHTGAGYEAQLICHVHGQPMPKVSWSRIGDALLDKLRHRQEQDGAQYSLTINEVRDSDLGQYTCRARSDLGTAAAVIELSGQPKEVMMTSPPHGQEKDSYTLRWNVESYAPVEEYKVTYKMAQMNGSSPKWEQITVQAPPKDGSSVMYSHMHVLRNLAPATAYEAVVMAKNKYGWSQEPKQAFKLYTLGSPLGSTDRNDASSVRSGGVLAAVAALGALLAVL